MRTRREHILGTRSRNTLREHTVNPANRLDEHSHTSSKANEHLHGRLSSHYLQVDEGDVGEDQQRVELLFPGEERVQIWNNLFVRRQAFLQLT